MKATVELTNGECWSPAQNPQKAKELVAPVERIGDCGLGGRREMGTDPN